MVPDLLSVPASPVGQFARELLLVPRDLEYQRDQRDLEDLSRLEKKKNIKKIIIITVEPLPSSYPLFSGQLPKSWWIKWSGNQEANFILNKAGFDFISSLECLMSKFKEFHFVKY